jgi:dolichol kinase
MELRLHRGGRFRTWLGARFGGGFDLGDRVWRRALHALAAAVLVYYLLPAGFFGVVPKWVVLWTLLAALLVIELLRHVARLELPTVRPYEARRVGSYVWLAASFVVAVTFLPEGIAAAVVLGTAFGDPAAGETRRAGRLYPGLPLAVYAGLAFVGLYFIGRWPLAGAAPLAVAAALVGVAVERPKIAWLDDDLLMTFVPAALLYGVGVLALGW